MGRARLRGTAIARRAETISQPKWRVQVWSPLGEVTHESLFGAATNAESYYETIYIPKSAKRLEMREAGASRFKLLKREEMVVTADKCPCVSPGGTPCRLQLDHEGVHIGSSASGGSVWWEGAS